MSLSLLSPESCARSWGTVHGQHRESLSRPEGCSQSAPAPLPAPCAFLSSELLDLSIPRLLACGSEQLHPLGGAVTAFWGVPNTPGGCRDRGGSVLGGLNQARTWWHCRGHCGDITGFSLFAWRVPAVGTDLP